MRVIRQGGIVLVSRIAGQLLPAIAVQLAAESVLGFVAEAR
jgi:multiple antibiotic resistance protein